MTELRRGITDRIRIALRFYLVSSSGMTPRAFMLSFVNLACIKKEI
jgi:hypothetical protein